MGLQAQEEEDTRPWNLKSELGANVFFGATDQTTVAFTTTGGYEAAHWLWSGRIGYDYGEAQDQEGVVSVNKRSWIAAVSLDYLPGGAWTPFVMGTVESSLERQIYRRYSGGAGVRWIPIDEGGKKLDFGLGAKVERTEPRVEAGETAETTTLGRWYTEGKLDWPIVEDRVTFNLYTFYQPEIGDFGNYTVDVDTGITFALVDAVALRVSLLDRYDSKAEERGARSNNDGRLLFSIVAAID